jgi:D-amino-acid dehydrogenase
MHVIVIGAGLAGLSVAWYLREGGAAVTLLERNASAGMETSFANGGLLHPSMVEPWNSPGVLGFLLRNIGRADAPMLVRLRVLPGLLGWGARFIRASRADSFLATTRRNLMLARYSVELMGELRNVAALKYGAYARGSLQVFRTDQVARTTLEWVRQLADDGLDYRLLSAHELIALEPALAPIADSLVGAIHYPRDEGGDAHLFCRQLAARLQERGVAIRYDVGCKTLVREGRDEVVVVDSLGQRLKADAVVLATGSISPLLAKSIGLALPICPVKGYSITMPRTEGALAPHVPVTDPVLHIAVVPVGEDRIRLAGTAEFAGYDGKIDPPRISNLVQLLKRIYPHYAQELRSSDIAPWAGLRPMSADGMPLLGRTRIRNLFLNTGHGQLGWTMAAGSGRLVADVILNRKPEIDPSPYALARFRRH